MITFAIDENNDLIFLNGSIVLDINAQAVADITKSVCSTVLGEMIFNADQGIPYFDIVWNGVPNLSQAEYELRTAILSVDNVDDITDFSLFVSDDTLSYNATIQTTFGEVSIGL